MVAMPNDECFPVGKDKVVSTFGVLKQHSVAWSRKRSIKDRSIRRIERIKGHGKCTSLSSTGLYVCWMLYVHDVCMYVCWMLYVHDVCMYV